MRRSAAWKLRQMGTRSTARFHCHLCRSRRSRYILVAQCGLAQDQGRAVKPGSCCLHLRRQRAGTLTLSRARVSKDPVASGDRHRRQTWAPCPRSAPTLKEPMAAASRDRRAGGPSCWQQATALVPAGANHIMRLKIPMEGRADGATLITVTVAACRRDRPVAGGLVRPCLLGPRAPIRRGMAGIRVGSHHYLLVDRQPRAATRMGARIIIIIKMVGQRPRRRRAR